MSLEDDALRRWAWDGAQGYLAARERAAHTPGRGGRLRAFCLRHDPRLWFLAWGVALHLGIASTMDVGPFSYITLSFYVCCLHPDELHALWHRGGAFSSPRRSAASA